MVAPICNANTHLRVWGRRIDRSLGPVWSSTWRGSVTRPYLMKEKRKNERKEGGREGGEREGGREGGKRKLGERSKEIREKGEKQARKEQCGVITDSVQWSAKGTHTGLTVIFKLFTNHTPLMTLCHHALHVPASTTESLNAYVFQPSTLVLEHIVLGSLHRVKACENFHHCSACNSHYVNKLTEWSRKRQWLNKWCRIHSVCHQTLKGIQSASVHRLAGYTTPAERQALGVAKDPSLPFTQK